MLKPYCFLTTKRKSANEHFVSKVNMHIYEMYTTLEENVFLVTLQIAIPFYAYFLGQYASS